MTRNHAISHADQAAARRLKAIWNAMPRAERPTQQQLADSWRGPREANQSLISQYMNGNIPLNYRAVLFFARHLNCAPTEIRSDLPEQRDAITITREWPTSRRDGRLPYLGAGQIAEWIAGGQPDVTDWMYCPAEDMGPRAFVTVVQGVAMSPQVEDGAFVFVDPDQPVSHGRLALILMPRPTVRKIVMEGDARLLAATGRDWPGQKLTPMPADAVIAGAVVGKWVPA